MFLKIYNSKTAKSSLSLLKKLTLIKNQYPTKPDQDIIFFFLLSLIDKDLCVVTDHRHVHRGH